MANELAGVLCMVVFGSTAVGAWFFAGHGPDGGRRNRCPPSWSPAPAAT